MKKILLGALVAVATLSSCERDTTVLNNDPKNTSVANPDYLVPAAETGIVTTMATPGVNTNNFRFFTQQTTETQYTDEAKYNLVKRSMPDNFWTTMYRQINKVRLAKESLTDTNKTKLATLEALEIYAFSVLADTYGDIPYSKAIDIDENPNPVYDDALTVYKSLVTRIDAVNASLNGASSGFSTDKMFGGNPVKIKKFLNSLKLRIAVTLADADPAFAKATAESAYNSGVLTSNADNIGLPFDGDGLYTSPIFQEMVSSGRNDFVAANTLVDEMNAVNDPRRAKYFTTVAGVYKGGKYGAVNNYANFSHVNDAILIPNLTYNLVEYAEVEFMLAEAASKGFNVGSVATHYDNGISASMDYWGVSAADKATYLAANNYASATGTDKVKIGKQAWFATYNRGFEAWGFSRRLDFKAFVKPSSFDVPVRLPYPVKEGSVNNANRTAAVIKQFGDISKDTQGSKLFWDKY